MLLLKVLLPHQINTLLTHQILNKMEQEIFTMPKIGDQAPDFKAMTTQGMMQFSEYIKDSWTILFSHPADFTPVCTTEMTGFALLEDEFTKMNTKLVGLSIDSIHSHIAWVHNVKEKMGILMKFPIIADIDMKVAKLYGMLQPGESETAAVRAVFFIDPKGKIRLIMYYPLNVGRNMDEIVRSLQALQTADEHKVALPLNWRPGDKVIVSPPKTVDEMEARINSDYEMVDFYLAMKSL
jgi:peroxiredoxin (alkyl hydroperoxide reductase subunit C)